MKNSDIALVLGGAFHLILEKNVLKTIGKM